MHFEIHQLFWDFLPYDKKIKVHIVVSTYVPFPKPFSKVQF